MTAYTFLESSFIYNEILSRKLKKKLNIDQNVPQSSATVTFKDRDTLIFPISPFMSTFFMTTHNDSLWHPLHAKEGDEISMFWGRCLQSSISRLSFSFLALFFLLCS